MTSDQGAPFPPLTGAEPCRGPDVDPEIFFPLTSRERREAKELCEQCPLRAECLAYALGHGVSGIWGGTDQRERRRVQRARGIVPVPLASMVTDAELIVRAHRRGLPNQTVADLAGVSVPTVASALSAWRRRMVRAADAS